MKDKNITQTMPDKWEFNEAVTECFEEMLSRSIPDYTMMRELVTGISTDYILDNNLEDTNILDLGSSQGRQIELLAANLPNRIYGVEKSEAMLKHMTRKFQHKNNIKILNQDLTKTPLPIKNCGLITAILTIQFIPIEYRQKLITNIHENLTEKGLFILIEKTTPKNPKITKIYEKQYHKFKEKQGYTKKEITDKKTKLEGTLIPLTNQTNLQMLKQAGFTKIDTFWQNLNFIGYLAIKQ